MVSEALEWDNKDNISKPPKDRKPKHLSDLVDCIQSCGVTLNVWEKRNADGKGSGAHAFTSLMVTDKKRLMRELPDKLHGINKPASSETVIKIWKVIFQCAWCIEICKHNKSKTTNQFPEFQILGI